MSSLHILDNCPLSDMSLANIYPNLWLLFILLTLSFAEQKCFLLSFVSFFYKKILFIYFLERGEGREGGGREREKDQCVRYINWLPLTLPQMGNLACNPGMCPDWGLNLRAFGSQAGTQSTEPHQLGQKCFILMKSSFGVVS